ncbi:DUF5020 family protein [Psychrobacter sp.]|uniref:DUF5020 family protein n=1 Tax=Psychrobacter sp. TaxID=56811 RepID=UPI0025FB589F|nr:DUF5020 family protein [Psychrobacter sp.]
MHFDNPNNVSKQAHANACKLSTLNLVCLKSVMLATVTIGSLGLMSTAQAKTFFSDTSISALYGSDYELVEDGELTTVTLEHVSAHDWGGVFFFVDRHQGDKNDEGATFKETYGELSPKFKLGNYKNGLIKQINLAGTYEFGSNSSGFSQDNYLVGIGVDLNLPIPNMKYASATLYHAFNDNTDDDQQITLTYGWEKNNVVLEGYVDYAFNNDDREDNIHINPQIKYNLQDALDIDNRLEVGVEYSYWNNKYGIDGVNQSAPSALVKFHF